ENFLLQLAKKTKMKNRKRIRKHAAGCLSKFEKYRKAWMAAEQRQKISPRRGLWDSTEAKWTRPRQGRRKKTLVSAFFRHSVAEAAQILICAPLLPELCFSRRF